MLLQQTRSMSILILLIAAVAVAVIDAERLYMKHKPEFFKNCSTALPDFVSCYKDNLQALLTAYKDGIPGLTAADRFEPLRIKRLKIAQDQLTVELRNLTVHGISATNITHIKHDPRDFSFRVRIHVPTLRVTGRYRTNGQMLFVPINSNGKLTLQADAVDLAFLFVMRLQDEYDASNGGTNHTFADPQTVHSKIKSIGDFHVELKNLARDSNGELERYANELLNTFWRDVIELLRPTLEGAIDAVTLARFKTIFNYIPANYFIADVPSAATLYGRQ